MPELYLSDFNRPRAIRDARAVVMAGGRSERMRATNGPAHKALVQVAGMSLLERNLRGLLREGFTDIVVVTSTSEPELDAVLSGPAAALVHEYGARLETFAERIPLGNIGAAGVLSDGERDLVIVYVDNLSTLRSGELLARHRDAGAALTFASHQWPLQNPFGELEVEAGFVRAYHEKPIRHVRISSGNCVVGPSAAAIVPADRPFGAVQLCAATIAAGLTVAAFEHAELWIDINDAAALVRAEALLTEHAERFAG